MEASSNPRPMSHGSLSISDQLLEQWQSSNQEENAASQNQHEESKNLQFQAHRSSEADLMQHGFSVESQQEQISCSKEANQPLAEQKDDQLQQATEQKHLQFSQKSASLVSDNSSISSSEPERMRHFENHQYAKMQRINSQQAPTTEPVNNPVTQFNKQIPFAILFPAILPHIDKDRGMQLQAIYNKLKVNEISKENFVRLMRNIVGDQMLRQAFGKVQLQQGQAKVQVARNSQTRPNQFQNDAGFSTENIAKNSREADNQSDSHVNLSSSSSMNTAPHEIDLSSTPLPGFTKQQQQHVNPSQPSFPMFGASVGINHPHDYSGAAVSDSTMPVKSQTRDSQMRQIPLHQGMASNQSGIATQPTNLMSVPKYDMQNSMNEQKRLQSGSLPHMATHSMLQHTPVPWQASMNKEPKSSAMLSMAYVKQELIDQTQEQQHKSHLHGSTGSSFGAKQDDQANMAPSSTNSVSGSMATQLDASMPMRTLLPSTTSLITGTNVRTPKKPSTGQKKPLSTVGIQPPMAGKKQKVTGAFLDQSIEQLNDVTAVSGVNLREEEEQLLSGPKEENRASEATRRVVQEEEERLLLQKNPLQKKLAKIMSSCGIKNIGIDVERCLSLCVEERMRGLISNMIKVSKQRADIEKLRHQILINSDVQRGILLVNQKAKEEWERKQAEEAEKLRKLNEAESNTEADNGKEKDEGRLKTQKANKEEDDKMRTTAANVAARVAVGGDDMLSKWQMMAEQARQKREIGSEMGSSTLLGKDLSRKPLSTSGRVTRDNQDPETRETSGAFSATATAAISGAGRKIGKNQVVWPPAKITRTISVKDLIAVLVREPQMAKSTLVERLYEGMHADSAAEC